MHTSKSNGDLVIDYYYYKRPDWELRTLCIVCKQPIIHNQYQKSMKCRIAHLSCSRRYWKKK